MKRILASLVLLSAAQFHVHGQEQSVESRIDSVSLFKNGLTVVKRTIQVPTNGTYRIEDVPEPVHGTFWIESEATVEARVTSQEVEVPLRAKGWDDFQDGMAGHVVSLYFRDGNIPPVDGKVVQVEPAKGEEAWNRTYQQPQYRYYGYPQNPPPQGRFLVLKTSRGRVYVDSSMVAYADVKGTTDTVLVQRPVLLLSVSGMASSPASITISYLTKGLAWAPSYRVDISDPNQLGIAQKAVIKNELGNLDNAELSLISGFPNIEFAHVTSPLSLNTSWANFFQQLNQRLQNGSDVTSQRAAPIANNVAPDSGLDLSAMPTGEGPDVHYQSIGKRTLQEGDSLSLATASGTADYERIVEWVVPDTRKADGRYIQDYDRNRNPEKYEDTAWDAIRFKNPLPFPMTTGPAMIIANGRFLGEQTSYWVNKGEETTLHITKALSIRTRAVEHEEPGQREVVYIAGDDFQKTVVKGELTASNHRNEPVTLVIRRRFSGDLLTADGDPKCSLLEEGAWSVNKRNELVWTVMLESGEEQTLTYSYSVLVNR